MRLTVHGHACVRIEKPDGVLVLDPGSYSDLSVLDDADAVAVTHEHHDHVQVGPLVEVMVRRGSAGPVVWAPSPVAEALAVALREAGGAELADRVRAVGPGEHLRAAGFDLETFGGRHAVVHPDVPTVANIGYLVDGRIIHPGDAFAPLPPGRSAEVLLLPVAGPWLKLSEAIDHARDVAAAVVVPIHDAVLSDVGRSMVDRVVAGLVPGRHVRLAPGEVLPL